MLCIFGRDQIGLPYRGCSFVYSALVSFRMGMSGPASFQMLKKSWYAAFALAVSHVSAHLVATTDGVIYNPRRSLRQSATSP
jgi:hypothetical protein